MRKIERYINNIMIDGVLVHKEKMTGKDERGSNWENNWVEIEPKYYIDKSDDMILEIWYGNTGIILDRGLNTRIKNDEISTKWYSANLEEINKKLAMIKHKERLLREERLAELDAKGEGIGYYDKAMMKIEMSNYNNENLMKRSTEWTESSLDEWTKTKSDSIDAMKYNIENNKLYMGVDFSNDETKGCNAEPIKQQNNGGSSDWYSLPDNAKTLQDLIEHRNMNGAVKDMFKACYRLGIKTEDELRDLNKTAYYALREIGRVSGRKDYITIAKELIGSQAIEKE